MSSYMTQILGLSALVVLSAASTSTVFTQAHAVYGVAESPTSGSFVVVTEGDTLRFAAVGDYGDDNAAEASVSSLIIAHAPDFVITTGDNSYDSTLIDDNVGQYYSSFIGNYVGTYGPGSVPNQFFPSLGNHDISDGGGVSAYLAYFTLPDSGALDMSTSGNERYYDFVRGPVHFFAINSNSSEPDGRTSTSTQAQWLEAQLAASESPWQVVYFHHPAYSSSSRHGSDPVMQWPFEEWGADAVFSGHDHVYERLLVDQNGDSKTIPYFVTGNGGRPLYGFGTPLPESVVRYNGDYGAMLIEATDTYMNFKSYSINTSHGIGGLIDDYTIVNDVGFIVLVNAIGNGTVSKNPDEASYVFGDTVIVTAVPDFGWTFANWSGGLSGSENPDTIVITADTTITAHFIDGTAGVESVAVSSTSGSFETTDDLTSDYVLTGSAVTAASTWYRDGVPVMALYVPMEGGESSALYDYSGHGGVGSKSGTPVWMASGGHDGFGAWAFDGDDAIVLPDADGLDVDVVSLAAWIYVTAYVDDARIITKETGTSQPYSIYTMNLGGPGETHLELRLGLEGQNRQIIVSTSTIPLNTWAHVAATFDGSEVVFYIDGVPEPAKAVTSGLLRKNDEPVYIGTSQFWSHPFFQGRIDDARVYGYALTPQQVAALYASGGVVIAASETAVGEAWMVAVTPFSGASVGTTVNSNSVTIEDTAVGVPRLRPKTVMLQQNFPNPFGKSTWFNMGLPRAVEVRIDVFDVTGRRVYTEHIAQAPAGWSQVPFNGLDNDGRKLSAGVYFYRLSTGAGTAMRKIVILR